MLSPELLQLFAEIIKVSPAAAVGLIALYWSLKYVKGQHDSHLADVRAAQDKLERLLLEKVDKAIDDRGKAFDKLRDDLRELAKEVRASKIRGTNGGG